MVLFAIYVIKLNAFGWEFSEILQLEKKSLEEELQQKKISIYVPLKKEGLYLKTHLW